MKASVRILLESSRRERRIEELVQLLIISKRTRSELYLTGIPSEIERFTLNLIEEFENGACLELRNLGAGDKILNQN